MKDRLPEDWKIIKMGKLCTFKSGFACNKSNQTENGYIHLRTHNITSNGEINFKKVIRLKESCIDNNKAHIKKGQLLFNNTNSIDLVGKTCLVDKNYNVAFSNHITLITINNSVMPKYLHYYFKMLFSAGFFSHLCNKWIGQAGINLTMLKNIEIIVPPIEEQNEIIKVLDYSIKPIDKAISLLNKNLKKINKLIEANSVVLFENLKKKYNVVPLLKYVDFIGGSQPPKNTFSKTKKPNYVRLIQIRDYKSDKHIIYINKESTKKFCTKEDIMIGRYGPPVFQILKGIEGAYNVALMKAMPNETFILKDFLYFFLKNRKIQDYIISISQRSAGQSGVNKKALENYKIAIPSLKEQERIVKYLDLTTEKNTQLIKQYQNKLQSLQDLKKSILDNAFKGKLRREVAEVENSTVLDSLFPDLDAYSEVANLQQAIIVLKTKQTFGSGRGKVYLQKTSANIQKVEDVYIPYEFNMSNHGDFSWKLSEDLDNNPYLIKISTDYGDVFEIRKEKKKEVSEAIKSDKYSKFANAVKEMLAVYKDDLIEGVTDRVELLNTVMRAMKETNSIIGNTIYKFMGDWKISQNGYNTKADKFKPHETFAMIGLVRRLGWDKKILS